MMRTFCEVNMIESIVQNFVDHVSYDDPLKSCLASQVVSRR